MPIAILFAFVTLVAVYGLWSVFPLFVIDGVLAVLIDW